MSIGPNILSQHLSAFSLRPPRELFSSELVREPAAISELGAGTLAQSSSATPSPSRPLSSKRGRASITSKVSADDDFRCFPVLSSSGTQLFTAPWQTRFELILFYLTGALPETKPSTLLQQDWNLLLDNLAAGTLVKITQVQSSTTPPTFTIQVPSDFYRLGYAQVSDNHSCLPPIANVNTFLGNASFFHARVLAGETNDKQTSRLIKLAFPVKLIHTSHFRNLLEPYETNPQATNPPLIQAFLDFFNCVKEEYSSVSEASQISLPHHKQATNESLTVQKIIKRATRATCHKWETPAPATPSQDTPSKTCSKEIAMAILSARFSPPGVSRSPSSSSSSLSSSSSSSSSSANLEGHASPTSLTDDDQVEDLHFHTPPPTSESSSSTFFTKPPLSGWIARADIITQCLTGILPEAKPQFISEPLWAAVTNEAKENALSKLTDIRTITISERSTTYTIECSALFCDVIMAQVLNRPISDESYSWLVKFNYFGAKSKLKGSVRHLTFKFPIELDNEDYFRKLIARNLFKSSSVINGTLRGALMTYYKNFMEKVSSTNDLSVDECMLTAIENTRMVWKTTMTALGPAFSSMGL